MMNVLLRQQRTTEHLGHDPPVLEVAHSISDDRPILVTPKRARSAPDSNPRRIEHLAFGVALIVPAAQAHGQRGIATHPAWGTATMPACQRTELAPATELGIVPAAQLAALHGEVTTLHVTRTHDDA